MLGESSKKESLQSFEYTWKTREKKLKLKSWIKDSRWPVLFKNALHLKRCHFNLSHFALLLFLRFREYTNLMHTNTYIKQHEPDSTKLSIDGESIRTGELRSRWYFSVEHISVLVCPSKCKKHFECYKMKTPTNGCSVISTVDETILSGKMRWANWWNWIVSTIFRCFYFRSEKHIHM